MSNSFGLVGLKNLTVHTMCVAITLKNIFNNFGRLCGCDSSTNADNQIEGSSGDAQQNDGGPLEDENQVVENSTTDSADVLIHV